MWIKKFKLVILTCVLLGCFNSSYSQSIHDLKTKLNSKIDTAKFNANIECGQYYLNINTDSAAYFFEEAKLISGNLPHPYYKAKALNNIGWNFYEKSKYDTALILCKNALNIFSENRSTSTGKLKTTLERELIQSYSNIGSIKYRLAKYPEALENFYAALKICNEIKSDDQKSGLLVNLGVCQSTLNNKEKALKYYREALPISIKFADKKNQSTALGNIGNIYQELEQIDSATYYYTKALEINKELNNKHGIAHYLGNLAVVYSMENNFEKAVKFYNEAIQMDLELDDKISVGRHYGNLCYLHVLNGKYAKAEEYNSKALAIAKETKSVEDEIQAYANFDELYESWNKPDQALKYYKLYISTKDSIFNLKNTKESINQELKFGYQLKAAADSVKTAEEHKVFDAQMKQERTQKFALYGGLALITLFSIFVFYRFRVSQKQNRIIEVQKIEVDRQREIAESRRTIAEEQKHVIQEKQKEILDSIHYAKRIQNAMLTSDDYIKNNLPAEYFIFYQPKDIVSGDFYWALNHHDKFYIATADCTGHGVPGAFMSLLNISFLNENVLEKKIQEPAAILNEQRKSIIKALNPTGSENSKDGMDCVLCAFDFTKMELHFAAANNPLWHIRNNELTSYKADKMPVGKYDELAKDFTSRKIDLQKGDVIYTFTDGFADQFGGVKGKKFMYKNFQKILLANHLKPIEEQKEILKNSINAWMNQHEQIDDILVIGVRI